MGRPMICAVAGVANTTPRQSSDSLWRIIRNRPPGASGAWANEAPRPEGVRSLWDGGDGRPVKGRCPGKEAVSATIGHRPRSTKTLRQARKDRHRMTRQEREPLIAQYAAGYDQVAGALKGFPQAGLTARPIPRKWSAAGIVPHLAH